MTVSRSIFGQFLQKILGPLYTLVFLFGMLLLDTLYSLLRIGVVFDFIESWTVTPIMSGVWWLLSFPRAYIAYGINFAVSVVTAILPTMGTSIILLACSPVVILVAAFGFTIIDPFRLRRTRRMCGKALRTATGVLFTHWRSTAHTETVEVEGCGRPYRG